MPTTRAQAQKLGKNQTKLNYAVEKKRATKNDFTISESTDISPIKMAKLAPKKSVK